jgi:hypothetical protein
MQEPSFLSIIKTKVCDRHDGGYAVILDFGIATFGGDTRFKAAFVENADGSGQFRIFNLYKSEIDFVVGEYPKRLSSRFWGTPALTSSENMA